MAGKGGVSSQEEMKQVLMDNGIDVVVVDDSVQDDEFLLYLGLTNVGTEGEEMPLQFTDSPPDLQMPPSTPHPMIRRKRTCCSIRSKATPTSSSVHRSKFAPASIQTRHAAPSTPSSTPQVKSTGRKRPPSDVSPLESESHSPSSRQPPQKRALLITSTEVEDKVEVKVEPEGQRWCGVDEPDIEPPLPSFSPAKTPGPRIDKKTPWSPLSLFRLFFSTSVMRTIVENTNAQAQRQIDEGKKHKWKQLTIAEFHTFISVLVFSGLVSVHCRGDLWRKSWPYNFQFPSDTMSKERFETIMWSLHLSNPKEDQENERKKGTDAYDKLFRIKPLYTSMVQACKAHFQPSQQITIYERMVTSKANLSLKQYVKATLTKGGYKLFVLADSSCGYTWNFAIYDGKRGGGEQGFRNVMDLMDFRLLGHGYELYVDNYYTSPSLFNALWENHTTACGTILTSRQGYPKTRTNDLPVRAQRGDVRWLRDANLLFVKWMDTAAVNMLTTRHKASSGQTVSRKVKVAGKWRRVDVPVPDPVAQYNKSMGGVGLSEALIGYYAVHQKAMRWHKTFFYHFLDIAAVNSFILHQHLAAFRKEQALSQKKFREVLQRQLVECARAACSRKYKPKPRTYAARPELCIPSLGILPASSGKNSAGPAESTTSPEKSSEVKKVTCLPTFPGQSSTNKRGLCKKCQQQGRSHTKTPVFCPNCGVYLCCTPTRNCFFAYHEDKLKFDAC